MIRSKPPSKEYMENYDKIFRSWEEKQKQKRLEQQLRLEPDGSYIPESDKEPYHEGE